MPTSVATNADTNAIINVLLRASIIILLSNKSSYHFKENPVSLTGSLDSLKEKINAIATKIYGADGVDYTPEAEKEFPSVMLEDQDLKDELKNKKQIDLEVILDFTYLPVMVEGEEEGERPKNPLLFMAYDNTDGGVITMDILEEGDDEISRTLGFFISFVQQNGRMKTIKARNPWIFGALEDICEYCSVDLVYDPVEIMDQVIEEVISQL